MAAMTWTGLNSIGQKSFFVELTLTSPRLVSGNVVEMSITFPNPARADSYDIAVSQVTYENEQKILLNPYDVQDLESSKKFPFAITGTTTDAYKALLDTAKKGASDWNVSRQLN